MLQDFTAEPLRRSKFDGMTERLPQEAETSAVLLESAPSELDTSALAKTIGETEGVASFHDLHAWRISDGFDAVTVHVVLAPNTHGVEVSQRVCQRVEALHGIRHVTVQPEAPPPTVLVQLGRQRRR